MMGRYGNPDYDDLSYEIREFLKQYPVSVLLMIVQRTVEDKEYEETE